MILKLKAMEKSAGCTYLNVKEKQRRQIYDESDNGDADDDYNNTSFNYRQKIWCTNRVIVFSSTRPAFISLTIKTMNDFDSTYSVDVVTGKMLRSGAFCQFYISGVCTTFIKQ